MFKILKIPIHQNKASLPKEMVKMPFELSKQLYDALCKKRHLLLSHTRYKNLQD